MIAGFQSKNHPHQIQKRGAIKSIDDRAVMQSVFDELIQKPYNLTVDATVSLENAKLPRFWTEEQDALSLPWDGERVYCNPPYSDIEAWVKKAWCEWKSEMIVMLLPANRTEQGWWQTMVEPYRDKPDSALSVRFIAGRIRFLQAGETKPRKNSRPPFGSCLLIWKYGN